MKITLCLTLLLFGSLSTFATASTKPYCVSHRANGFGELENSLAAFEAAAKAQTGGIEFDLHHTQDKKTIVYHDKVFDRLAIGATCPKGYDVHELSLSAIRTNCSLSNGEVIPTFEEALQVFSKYDSTLFVELKDTITEADFSLIKQYYSERPEKVVIISFSTDALDLVNKKAAEDNFFKTIKTMRLKKYGYTGSFKNYDGADVKYMNKLRVKALKKKGKLVGFYTKDSSKRIKKYLNKGADFITTNEPTLCREIIESL